MTNEVHAAMVKEYSDRRDSHKEAIAAINDELGRTWTASYIRQHVMGNRLSSSELRAEKKDRIMANDSAKACSLNQVKQLEYMLQVVEKCLTAWKSEEGRRLGDPWPLPKAA